ncbi:hypothetical protein PUN28_014593 [Cardiocondyla obscurior]|uniref:Uncharacterized protein n=1 Tax=Cardiocondyla obscurior TaxID=286306 RepID=A0AAW2F0V9_9HYME
MNLTKATIAGGCLRFKASQKPRIRRVKRNEKKESTAGLATQIRFTRKQITELLFESCADCAKMASIPQGAFAVWKVRHNEHADSMSVMKKKEKIEDKKENTFNPRLPLQGWELTPLKYNSKLMNSIWGLYNRYSVHNFKKNTDAKEGAHDGVVAAIWRILGDQPQAAKAVVSTSVEAPRILKTKL